jgi:hypothetical protein
MMPDRSKLKRDENPQRGGDAENKEFLFRGSMAVGIERVLPNWRGEMIHRAGTLTERWFKVSPPLKSEGRRRDNL